MEVQVGPSVVTIHSDDQVVVCEPDSRMSSTEEQGFFARDTRMISGYRLKLGRVAPVLLNSSEIEHYSSHFEFTNPRLDTANGPIEAQSMRLRLDRTVGGGVHEDYDITNYSGLPASVELEVSFESDFADLFDVKSARRVRRGSLQSTWDEATATLRTAYRNGSFHRAIEVRAANSDSPTEFANGGVSWRITLEPGGSWHTCLLWTVDLGDADKLHGPDRTCHAVLGRETATDRTRRRWAHVTTSFSTSDPIVTAIAHQAVEDLASLRIHIHDDAARSWGDEDGAGHGDDDGDDGLDYWVPAAGIPWFVSLFGRDSLIVSLQTPCLSSRFALGALRALGRLQADSYDDERDMQPGKIEHEVRHGELACLHLIPHTPYYGTHEATTLYVWAAAKTWWWHGDRAELDAVRPHVERALAWIDRDGDIDGDGLQEYRTRARTGGYYNQGWKDSGDAIVDDRGELASLPIALCEHQGYVVAAKRAWAEVLERVYEDAGEAGRLRAEADRLADMIEERFWWDEEGTYYLGLDGSKRPLRSVASNPGHLLWCGVVDAGRAQRTAERLLADDMWTGWGIRTLSSQHPSYNPFSYQLGSVWPHDNVIAAAGFRRYGLDDQAARVIRGIFDAAARFRSARLPELFAGLQRGPGSFPVQYLGANVPQAWAAGAVIQAVDVLLGLEADAPGGRLTLRPALPDWLSEVGLTGLGVGPASVDLIATRQADGSHRLEVGGAGSLEVALAPGC
ncbi:MAG TPA: glycogen debranching N-terminal domain-containing protein [Acidimicrobiales bacterium]|nr:glycogen debranching N-terminal domain-containing protein [Acidimicrobiales bacterium]